MKQPSINSEVRAYVSERDQGTKLTIREVAKDTGNAYGAVSASLSQLYTHGFLAREKRGTYVTTTETIKCSERWKSANKPAPYTKDVKNGGSGSGPTARLQIADFVNMLARVKDQTFDLALTVEKLQHAAQSLDLSLVPEDALWREIQLRRVKGVK